MHAGSVRDGGCYTPPSGVAQARSADLVLVSVSPLAPGIQLPADTVWNSADARAVRSQQLPGSVRLARPIHGQARARRDLRHPLGGNAAEVVAHGAVQAAPRGPQEPASLPRVRRECGAQRTGVRACRVEDEGSRLRAGCDRRALRVGGTACTSATSGRTRSTSATSSGITARRARTSVSSTRRHRTTSTGSGRATRPFCSTSQHATGASCRPRIRLRSFRSSCAASSRCSTTVSIRPISRRSPGSG